MTFKKQTKTTSGYIPMLPYITFQTIEYDLGEHFAK